MFPPAQTTVTPLSQANVTCPAPVCITIITVPIGNATDALVGTVMVTADPEVESIVFHASDKTRVYAVPA